MVNKNLYKRRSIDSILENDPFLNKDLGFCDSHKMRPYYCNKKKWINLVDECPDCNKIKNSIYDKSIGG